MCKGQSFCFLTGWLSMPLSQADRKIIAKIFQAVTRVMVIVVMAMFRDWHINIFNRFMVVALCMPLSVLMAISMPITSPVGILFTNSH